MTTVISPSSELTVTPDPPMLLHCGRAYQLVELDNLEFSDLYDRLLDDGNDKQLRAEGWNTCEWELNRDWYERWKAQHYYNLELLEVEDRRRNQAGLVAAGARAA